MRCVEAWSMVIPWVGIPLADVVKRFKPTSRAKYLAFETLEDRERMPGQRFPVLDWPYREGLRSTRRRIRSPSSRSASTARPCRTRTERRSGWSCRGNTASRASSRSCASASRSVQPKTALEPVRAARIRLLRERESRGRPSALEPGTGTPHRRPVRGQAPTLMFNGYAEQVAHLYDGLDLRRNF